MRAVIIFTIILLLAIVGAWHLLFPIVGGAVAITATVWGMMVASVVALSAAILLAFVFTGVGLFIIGIAALLWVILSLVLFPIMFPIVIPLMIIILVIAYIRRKQLPKKPLSS